MCAYLGGLSVGGLLDLVGALVGVADAEDAELVAVGGGHVNVAGDHSLPLLHHRAHLVTVYGRKKTVLKLCEEPQLVTHK